MKPLLRTGITGLEFPISALTQIDGAGKTTLLHGLLANTTTRGACCALVDACDRFDPASAEAAGAELSRLLWVRCAKDPAASKWNPLERAFKAADMLLNGGGFAVIALDLAEVNEAKLRRVPLTTWFRFTQVVERMPTALVVLIPAAVHTNAALLVEMEEALPQWSQSQEHVAENLPAHAQVLCGMSCSGMLSARRVHGEKKLPQRCVFTAEWKRA